MEAFKFVSEDQSFLIANLLRGLFQRYGFALTIICTVMDVSLTSFGTTERILLKVSILDH